MYICTIVHIPLHLLQPWQAWFLCRDSDYLWDSSITLFIVVHGGKKCQPINVDYRSTLYALKFYFCVYFLASRGGFPSTLRFLQYNPTVSIWEMPDSNPRPLPQKSGDLPMSHHISISVTKILAFLKTSRYRRKPIILCRHTVCDKGSEIPFREAQNVIANHKNSSWLLTVWHCQFFLIDFFLSCSYKWNIWNSIRKIDPSYWLFAMGKEWALLQYLLKI